MSEPDLETALRNIFWFDDQQARYKEFLADALVSFNRIENFVSDMIATILKKSGRDEIAGRVLNKQFMGRVEALELLVIGIEGAPPVPYKQLKALADKRNEFAHGHFSTEENTGALVILGKGKSTPWDESTVTPFLDTCAAMRLELSQIYAYVLFGNIPADLPDGATSASDPNREP